MENKIKQEQEFAGKQILPYLGMVFLGETLKVTALLHLTNYNLLQGHLSDFALSAEASSYCLYTGNSKLSRLISVLAPPTVLTVWEFLQGYALNINTDPIDIACYCAGSIIAYLNVKTLGTKEKREKIRNFFTNYNPFKYKHKKNSLEKIVKINTKNF